MLQLELHARGAATATSLRVLRFHSRAFVQVAVASYREPRGPRRALLDQVLRYDDHAPTGRKIADP